MSSFRFFGESLSCPTLNSNENIRIYRTLAHLMLSSYFTLSFVAWDCLLYSDNESAVFWGCITTAFACLYCLVLHECFHLQTVSLLTVDYGDEVPLSMQSHRISSFLSQFFLHNSLLRTDLLN